MRQYCLIFLRILILVFLIQIINRHLPQNDISPAIPKEDLDLSYQSSVNQTMDNQQTTIQNHVSKVDTAIEAKEGTQISNDFQTGDPKEKDNGLFANDRLFQELFSQGRILSEEETVENSDKGHYKRITIWETEFKYPYIRVEETFVKKLDEEDDIILARKAMVADHILVKIKAGYGQEQLEQLNQKHQAETIKSLNSSQIYMVKFSHHTINTVSNAVRTYGLEQSLVAYAEPDYIVQILDVPNDPKFQDQWNLSLGESFMDEKISHIDATRSWDIETGSTDIVVAIVDTGVDYYHQDLLENIWENPGEIGLDLFGNDKATNGIDDDGNGYIDDYHGWNFYDNNNDSMDDNRHGTHVAGIIGASGNNEKGISGVCWKTSLLPIKFLSSAGIGATSDAVAALNYCIQLGVDISNNSWGGGDYSQALKDVIDNAHKANCIVVAAAGNEGQDINKSPVFPASYDLPNVVSVTASSQNGNIPEFANYGLKNVDLAAPGVRILSTFPNDKYGYLEGTSMAAPHVAGALAMLRSRFPDLAIDRLKGRLLAATDVSPALEGKCQTGGRLNLFKALNDKLMAHFEFDIDYGKIPAVVKFTNTSFGSIKNLRWDFGDDSLGSMDQNPTHVFESEGIYHVTLTIEGDDGVSRKTRAISVMGSYNVAEIPFSWIDPTEKIILEELENDNVSTVQKMPFTFKFYGNSYEKLYIGSNGLIGFTPNELENPSNRNLPQVSLSTPALFPYWDDLNPAAGGTIHVGVVGDAPDRQFVVTWQDIPYFYKPSPPFSFQVVLNETTHDIEFHYREVHPENPTIGGGRSATIGIQSANAILAATYAYNGSRRITNNQSLLFSRERVSEMPSSARQNEIFELNLQPSWNLVSTPLAPLTSEVSNIFHVDSMSNVTYWDNQEGSYQVTTEIKPNLGYWVFSQERLDVKIEGNRPQQFEITLGMGWNLVGVTKSIRPDDYNMPIDTIWGWNSKNQSYVAISSEDYLVPGQGYWVFSSEEFNLKISE